jgi:hypothetical protein
MRCKISTAVAGNHPAQDSEQPATSHQHHQHLESVGQAQQHLYLTTACTARDDHQLFAMYRSDDPLWPKISITCQYRRTASPQWQRIATRFSAEASDTRRIAAHAATHSPYHNRP